MMNVDRIRGLLNNLHNKSERVHALVDGIIGEFIGDMDLYLEEVRQKVNNGEVSDGELEQITIRLPLMIYFANDRLEDLGLEGDIAEAVKSEAFGESYLSAEGTIPERESRAELDTLEEDLIEKAYKRAYKKLKSKIEKAESVYTGVKKVLDKRAREVGLSMMSQNNVGYRDNEGG